MDKHTKKNPSLFRYPVLVAFGLFFIGLFVLDMACCRPTARTVSWKTPP